MSFASQFDALHQQAMQATALDDFGAMDYVEPMKLLLADYDRYNDFTEAGKQIVSGWVMGALIGRLFAHKGFKDHPRFTGASVKQPLIILGMVRTGSTALLKLLASDPANLSLPYWLGSTPMPRPPRDTWESNPWYQATVKGLADFYQANPQLRNIHEMIADQADECRIVIDHTFWSSGLSSTASVPTYTDWCIRGDARYAYQYHRKVLGLIAGEDARRWVLKDPSHIYGLDSLLSVYPDARIVFTHRDIMTSMASGASLTLEVRRMRDANLDMLQHGREHLYQWGKVLDKTEKVRRQHDPAQFFDVHMQQLRRDPLGTVEAIYRHFDIPLSEHSRQAMEQHLATDTTPRPGAHEYSAADFGLTEKNVYAGIGDYYERSMEINGPYAKT